VNEDASLRGRIYRVDVATGRKELWKELMPSDPAGVDWVFGKVTPDGKPYAYFYRRILSDLFLVESLE
jgi:hypothetical protein